MSSFQNTTLARSHMALSAKLLKWTVQDGHRHDIGFEGQN